MPTLPQQHTAEPGVRHSSTDHVLPRPTDRKAKTPRPATSSPAPARQWSGRRTLKFYFFLGVSICSRSTQMHARSGAICDRSPVSKSEGIFLLVLSMRGGAAVHGTAHPASS